MKDFRFSYKFKMACKEDVLRLCPNIKKKSVSVGRESLTTSFSREQMMRFNAVRLQGGRRHLPQHHREERHAAGRQGAAGVAQVSQTAAGGGAGDGSAHTTGVSVATLKRCCGYTCMFTRSCNYCYGFSFALLAPNLMQDGKEMNNAEHSFVNIIHVRNNCFKSDVLNPTFIA